jgi:hypothetical protein
MSRFSLIRRRQVWLPTLPGLLVLVALVCAAGLLAARCIHPFLAPNDPAPGASVLVVEGWLEARELDQAIEAFRKGHYQRIVTTGGPIEKWPELSRTTSYAGLAAGYLVQQGLGDVAVTAVPAPASAQDRTFLSAVKLRDWAQREGLVLKALDVFSSGSHARRSRMLYQMALGPRTRVGVLSARPVQYDEEQWWQTSAGVKAVLGETISVTWTICCFYPPPPGSHEELWALPRQHGQP